MSKVNVWNKKGDILEQFETIEAAEAWIEECEHEELSRTHSGGDTNIAVLESF